jgi:Tfp pilus assembly protein PilF
VQGMTINKRTADIKKELISLVTYPYSDPSPIPEFGRLYPYNRFDGYTDNGYDQDWEMVVMENDYIKLWINPAVGGKVWGAIEKATNKEFIYFNHAAKFRDVAMRGPWTSGGMETNMGIIGHTPSCSSAVDYVMRTNADGSVSCFVGATDWPSRTNWTVEFCLPVDAAYFITRSSWYNNSGLEQSYYQWNNVGVKVSGNLEYINPGYQSLGHDGKSFSWPRDEKGRQISYYDQNDFGEYKSYHIFGSYSDFWGCYWHDDNFGFGHSASYDDKPGKKIWIWGLSRYGMIWEDILTDTDGQYTELQSGRLFNQSIAASTKTPFKHSSFLPYTFDNWDEYWFPVKDIDGLNYGNEQLCFSLIEQNGTARLNICAIQDLDQILKIEYGDKVITMYLVMDAMESAVITLPGFTATDHLKIWLNENLIYNAEEQDDHLSRPATIADTYNFDSVQAVYIQAKEWERQRFFERAIEQYHICLKKDPFYMEALNGLAGIMVRQAQYNEALKLLMTALSVDTYHPETNYLYGIVNQRLKNTADAKDGFSIAAQSLTYRAAAYTELAKMFFREQQSKKALAYLKKALIFNTKNQQALQLEVVINRLLGNTEYAKQLANELLRTNPLDHLIRFELYQLKDIKADDFKGGITSELPYETYLELNCFYFNLGLYDLCLEILTLAPDYAMITIWKAYLYHLQNSTTNADHYINIAIAQQPEFVFPHREEDIKALEWAANNYSSYKLKYYLALGYIQMLRTEEALNLLSACTNEPNFYVFYIVRANLYRKKNESKCEADLHEAYRRAPSQWRTALILSKYLAEKKRWPNALAIVKESYLKNPDNYYLGLQLAKCLMHTSDFKNGIELMNKLNVLPNEGASDGRNVWRETHLKAALQAIEEKNWLQALKYIDQARQWPENMGVGKPYEVDERLENFLELYSLQQGDQPVPVGLVDSIVYYRDNFPDTPYGSNDFLSLYLLQQNNRFEKAEQILNSWLQHDPNDLAMQWSLAFMDGDTEKLNNIASMHPKKREPLPYEILFEDRSFPFVKQMHERNFFNMLYNTTK